MTTADMGMTAAGSAGWKHWTRQARLQAAPLRRAFVRLRTRTRLGGAGARRLPDFLIIGAQRAGTTSLYNYLRLHPDVLEPLVKEPNYFSLQWPRGEAWYRSNFPMAPRDGNDRSLTFEASPYYLFHPRAAVRAATMLPDARLIALVRNPVERAYSHHQHNVRRHLETLTFAEAIASENERLAGDAERMEADATYQSRAHRLYSYAARGFYADQLARWYEHFPSDRLLVVQSEDLYASPAAVFGQVLAFLGLDPWRPAGGFPNFSRSRSNDGSAAPVDIRARLVETFATHNARLGHMLGRDFTSWDQ